MTGFTMNGPNATTLTIRDADETDAAALCDILNPLIEIGGSTAHQTRFDERRMLAHYLRPVALVSCIVAQRDGEVLGFQSLVRAGDPMDPLPDGWGVIASFVALGQAGQGIGQALFAATRKRAERAQLMAIDATIRADNAAGLRYYGGLGFRDWDRLCAIPMADGTPVDRIRKRYDL